MIIACLIQTGCHNACTTCSQDEGSIHGIAIQRDGRGYANAIVSIGTEIRRSGADGSFHFENVELPYDLVTLNVDRSLCVVYQGLTTRRPTVYTSPLVVGYAFTTISGKLPALSAEHGTSRRVLFSAPGGDAWLAGSIATDGTYEYEVRWKHDTYGFDLQGHLIVLMWKEDPETEEPTEYTGFAEKALTVNIQTDLHNIDLAFDQMSRPETRRLSGTVALPPEFSHSSRRLEMLIRDTEVDLVSKSNRGPLKEWDFTDTFEYLVPVLPGARLRFAAAATHDVTGSVSRSLVSDLDIETGNIDVVLRPPPIALSPENAAEITPENASLQWQTSGTGAHMISIRTGDFSPPSYLIFTRSPQVALPNLHHLNLELLKRKPYYWSVIRMDPPRSMDGVATARFWKDEEQGVGGRAYSETRWFEVADAPQP